ncbi:hypothetical protein BHM03_00023515 [Ensete ventricosum]|nr:hypothetical protein BHM03_00023515 [Ensete ventricosum]
MMGLMAVSSPTISTSQLHSSLRGFHPRPQPLWLRARPSLPGPRSSRGLRVSATAALSVEQVSLVLIPRKASPFSSINLIENAGCFSYILHGLISIMFSCLLNLRSPLVSFLYERGWRQNFSRSGFPGLDEEVYSSPLAFSYCILFTWQFNMAQEYFKPVAGGLLVDVSCGSGLFSRKFAKSGSFSAVVALDFSENMLRQCYEFIKQDDTLITT